MPGPAQITSTSVNLSASSAFVIVERSENKCLLMVMGLRIPCTLPDLPPAWSLYRYHEERFEGSGVSAFQFCDPSCIHFSIRGYEGGGGVLNSPYGVTLTALYTVIASSRFPLGCRRGKTMSRFTYIWVRVPEG